MITRSTRKTPIGEFVEYHSSRQAGILPNIRDDYTKALLSFDGYAGSQSVNNTEQIGLTTWIANGNAEISHTSPKFGLGCLKVQESATSYIYSNDAILNPLSGDFTCECWINRTAGGGSAVRHIMGWGDDPMFSGMYNYDDTYQMRVVIKGSEWGMYDFDVEIGSLSAGWNHVAFARYGWNVYGFLNGTMTLCTEYLSDAFPTFGKPFTIGKRLKGYIDCFRYSNTCRWVESFTPQTAPY
jgi:hypothetical protein